MIKRTILKPIRGLELGNMVKKINKNKSKLIEMKLLIEHTAGFKLSYGGLALKESIEGENL